MQPEDLEKKRKVLVGVVDADELMELAHVWYRHAVACQKLAHELETRARMVFAEQTPKGD